MLPKFHCNIITWSIHKSIVWNLVCKYTNVSIESSDLEHHSLNCHLRLWIDNYLVYQVCAYK